jgi:peptidoglycan/LPS O-acetylase OafA/YrhL
MAERHAKGEPLTRRPGLFIVTLFIVLFASSLFKPTAAALRFGLAAVLAAVFLDASLRLPSLAVSHRGAGRVLAWLGVISYSCYLWHQPILVGLFKRLGDWGPAVRFGIGTVVSFAIAVTLSAVLYRTVEKPAAAIGKPRRQSAASRP